MTIKNSAAPISITDVMYNCGYMAGARLADGHLIIGDPIVDGAGVVGCVVVCPKSGKAHWEPFSDEIVDQACEFLGGKLRLTGGKCE